MPDEKSEYDYLKPHDFTQQRNEASREGIRGLLIINGGGAVALLAFLQAIWQQDKLLAKYIVIGISVLSLGVVVAGAANFLRYHASFNFQSGNMERWLLFRRSYISCWYLSLVCFLIGLGVVVLGAYCQLNA